MELTDNKLLIWEEQFTKYCSYENKCINNINYIGEIKNNLNKFLGKQKKDDVLFYKSLIETSHFYLNNALKIRKIKFLKDMNYLWGKIDERKNMDEVNKSNFMALIKDYRKISEDILSAKSNNTTLIWVKDDKVEMKIDDILVVPEYYSNVLQQLSSSFTKKCKV